MKCYYCETEFSGNVCPKCMAVYTITEEVKEEYMTEEVEIDASSQRNDEVIVMENKEEKKSKRGKGKKGKHIFDAVDILADIVESFLD